MKKIAACIDAANEWVGKITSWSVILLALLVTYDVVMRYVFNMPTMSIYEYSTYVYAFHFMIVAGYSLLHDSHVSIDIFHSSLSERGKVILDLVSYCIFFFPLTIVLLYYGTIYAWESWVFMETSWSISATPVYPVKTVIPVSMLLLLLQGISVCYKKIVFLRRGAK